MENPGSSRAWIWLAIAVGCLAGGVAYAFGVSRAVPVGLAAVIVALVVRLAPRRTGDAEPGDPGRRRFLAWAALSGLGAVAGGSLVGRSFRRLFAPDATPVMEEMARGLGAEYLQMVHRAYRPGRAGELQLLLAPFNSSNYKNESTSLVPRDPRTSHASVWMYLERIPLAVYAPGVVAPSEASDRVTLADVAPSIAQMIGFDEFLAIGREGRPLPGLDAFPAAPDLVVVFVIDGGGWNVLQHWPDAWPHLRDLFGKSRLYTNAVHGSFPAVTACAHATIGTGAYPRDHGITGHNVRAGSGVRKAYGVAGRADPNDILLSTLADQWYDANGGDAWVGQLGYQVWHLGMLGRGGTTRSRGDKPVAVFWDQAKELGNPSTWQPHNPDLYRLPAETPRLDAFASHQAAYEPIAPPPNEFDPQGAQEPCCSPPVIQFQGDLIDATLRSEGLGSHAATDLLFINFKSPDYTGHIYNFTDPHERIVLEAVDAELGRLVDTLERTMPGRYAMILTADHGQCPIPDDVDGARLDPIQLEANIQDAFGRSLFGVVEYVAPSEIFLDGKALWDAGVSSDEIAAFLRNYRYGDNLGPYVPESAIQRDLIDKPEFAAVFGADFLGSLDDVERFGTTRFTDGDPFGIPDYRSW
ncbi:MAG TPA: alkaline phosphatase family protein [Actinomycetota bacterium]